MMEYPAVNINTAAEEVNRLHAEVENNMRRTVQDAIRIGEILTNVKQQKAHGEFLPWLKAECSFSPKTADRYRQLYEYSDKIVNVTNLQAAYKQVETLEKQEKRTEEQKARDRVKEYRKTGVKPNEWRRGTDDKLVEEEEERDRRIAEAQRKMEDAKEEREQKRAERDRQRQEWIEGERLFTEAISQLTEQQEKRASFKKRIRLSDAGRDDVFVDALMDYLEELEDDNRRIEACYNIIKVAKNIAVELQQQQHQGAQ